MILFVDWQKIWDLNVGDLDLDLNLVVEHRVTVLHLQDLKIGYVRYPTRTCIPVIIKLIGFALENIYYIRVKTVEYTGFIDI